MDPGGSITYELKLDVSTGFAPGIGALTNTASITSSLDNTDSNSSNDSSSDVDGVTAQADLSVTNDATNQAGNVIDGSDNNHKLYAGDRVIYTITVTNGGPSDAQNVKVAETFDSNTVASSTKYCVAPCDPNTGTAYTSGANLTSADIPGLGTLAPDAITLKFTGRVKASFLPDGDSITSTATTTSDTLDPTTPNTTDAASTVNTNADVSVAQVAKNPNGDAIDATHMIFAGQVITYVATVHNGGPSDSQNVEIKDDFDVLLVNAKSYCVVSNAEPCTNANHFTPYTSGALVGLGTIVPGGSGDQTVLFQTKIPSSVANSTQITNSVNARSYANGADPATVDPDVDNNTSTNNTTVGSSTVNTEADMQVLSKTASPAGGSLDPLYAGNTVTYTIVVKNNGGPSDAQNVTVSDALTSSDFVSGTIKSCVVTGSEPCTNPAHFSAYTSGTALSLASPVVPDDIRTVKIMGQVKPSFLPNGGHTDNTATVASTTDDQNSGNNSSTLQTTVSTRADMQILSKTASPAGGTGDPLYAGNPVTYTIVVKNNGGPSDAQNVTVWDPLESTCRHASLSIL